MPFDKFVDMQSVSEERRKAIHGSLETMSVADLRQIVKELSDFEGDPWRENFVSVIEAHPEASFYRAVTQEAQSYFTVPVRIRVSGSYPAAAWDHCQRRRNDI